MNATGPLLGRTRVLTAYDPNTGNVLVHDQVNLFSYNFASNSYVRLSNNGTGIDYHLTGVVDPVRKKFVAIGNGEQWIYDISGRLLNKAVLQANEWSRPRQYFVSGARL